MPLTVPQLRQIKSSPRRARLEELIQSLEPPETVRWCIRLSVTNNIVRATAEIAALDQADLILLGWHRPAFNKNRLGEWVKFSPRYQWMWRFLDRGQERLENCCALRREYP